MREPRPSRRAGHQRANWLVRIFYDLCDEQRASVVDVADRAGLGRGTVSRWQAENSPRVTSLEAVLNVLGYRLAIVPIDCTGPQDIARWERRADRSNGVSL